MKNLKKMATRVLIFICIAAIIDEAGYRAFVVLSPGITVRNGYVQPVVLNHDFDPSKAKVGQTLEFGVANKANLAGSERDMEFPNGTRFTARIFQIDKNRAIGNTVWVHFEKIQLPHGSVYRLSGSLVTIDESSLYQQPMIMRDESLASLGIATFFMLGSLPAIPVGAGGGWTLSRGIARHYENPVSYFRGGIVSEGYTAGLKLSRDHHLPNKRSTRGSFEAFLSMLY